MRPVARSKVGAEALERSIDALRTKSALPPTLELIAAFLRTAAARVSWSFQSAKSALPSLKTSAR